MIQMLKNKYGQVVFDPIHPETRFVPCNTCRCDCKKYINTYKIFSAPHFYGIGTNTPQGTAYNACKLNFNGKIFQLYLFKTDYNQSVYLDRVWYDPDAISGPPVTSDMLLRLLGSIASERDPAKKTELEAEYQTLKNRYRNEMRTYQEAGNKDVSNSIWYATAFFSSQTDDEPDQFAELNINFELQNNYAELAFSKDACSNHNTITKSKAFYNFIQISAAVYEKTGTGKNGSTYKRVALNTYKAECHTKTPVCITGTGAELFGGLRFPWEIENIDLSQEKNPYQDWIDSRPDPDNYHSGDEDLITEPSYYTINAWIGDCKIWGLVFWSGQEVILSKEAQAIQISDFEWLEDSIYGSVKYWAAGTPDYCKIGDGDGDSGDGDGDGDSGDSDGDGDGDSGDSDGDGDGDSGDGDGDGDSGDSDGDGDGDSGDGDGDGDSGDSDGDGDGDNEDPPKPPEPPKGEKRCAWQYRSTYENGRWSEPAVIKSLGCVNGMSIFDNVWTINGCSATLEAVTTSSIGCYTQVYERNEDGSIVVDENGNPVLTENTCHLLNPPQPNPPTKYPLNFELQIDTANLIPFVNLHSPQNDYVTHTETYEGETITWEEPVYVGDGASLTVYETYYGHERTNERRRWMIPCTIYTETKSDGTTVEHRIGPSCSQYGNSLASHAASAASAARSLLTSAGSYDWDSTTTSHSKWTVSGCEFSGPDYSFAYGTRYHDCYYGSHADYSYWGTLVRVKLSRNADTPANATGVQFKMTITETISGKRSGSDYSNSKESVSTLSLSFGEVHVFPPATEFDMPHIIDDYLCSEGDDCYTGPDGVCRNYFLRYETYAPGCCNTASYKDYYCTEGGSLWTGKTSQQFDIKLEAVGYTQSSAGPRSAASTAAFSSVSLLEFSVPLEYDNYLKKLDDEIKEF